MAKPLVVEIPHELGREEARRRLVANTDKGKELLQSSGLAVGTMDWTGDHLDFAVSALGQKVDGQIDVGQESVRLEVRLPLILALFAERVQKIVSKEGQLLLTKK